MKGTIINQKEAVIGSPGEGVGSLLSIYVFIVHLICPIVGRHKGYQNKHYAHFGF